MVQLPNLANLSLFWNVTALGVGLEMGGIGRVPGGRFGGRLRLDGHYDDTKMLLEVPTGLRFSEVRVRLTQEPLLPAMRLAEVCSETLTKLSYTVTSIVSPAPSGPACSSAEY